MTKKFRTYSAAFKTEVVKKIADNNGNLNATARQLRIVIKMLSNWQNEAREEKLKGNTQYDHELMSALGEIKQHKRQLKIAE